MDKKIYEANCCIHGHRYIILQARKGGHLAFCEKCGSTKNVDLKEEE